MILVADGAGIIGVNFVAYRLVQRREMVKSVFLILDDPAISIQWPICGEQALPAKGHQANSRSKEERFA